MNVKKNQKLENFAETYDISVTKICNYFIKEEMMYKYKCGRKTAYNPSEYYPEYLYMNKNKEIILKPEGMKLLFEYFKIPERS